MAKNRAWIFIVLGLLFAIGAGVLVYVVLQQQASISQNQAAQLEVEQSAKLKLPVAARQIEIGERITPSDYLMKDYPLELVPVNAITDTAKLDNQLVVTTIGQGGTFQENQFVGSANAPVSDRIEPGNVVFAFPASDLLSESSVIRNGDRLDLLLSLDPPANQDDSSAPQRATLLTVQNIAVLQIISPPTEEGQPPAKPSALLLSVTPQDAVLIKYVKDSGGIFDFALRSRLDQEQYQVPPITFDDFAQTYGIR